MKNVEFSRQIQPKNISSYRDSFVRGDEDSTESATPFDQHTFIKQLAPGETAVSVVGTVCHAGKRPVFIDGAKQVITEGEIADQSGRIRFIAWNDCELGPTDTIYIENAVVKEWNGRAELQLKQETTVTKLARSLPLGCGDNREKTIRTVSPGDRNVTVEGIILDYAATNIDNVEEPKDVITGMIADHSGCVPFTDWAAREQFSIGSHVRIENAYIKEYRGLPTVNLSTYSTIAAQSGNISVPSVYSESTIATAVARGGGVRIEITGTIVAIGDRSGLVSRCPKCHRVLHNNRCRTHGDVDGVSDLRLIATVDDGTASVTVSCGPYLTASLVGESVETVLEASNRPDTSHIQTALTNRVFGRRVRIHGSLRITDGDPRMDADRCELIDTSATVEASSTLQQIREKQ